MRFAALCFAVPVVVGLPGTGNAPRTVAQGHSNPVPIASASVSADGRFVAFESRAQLSPKDTNSTTDIYVLHTDSGILELVSDAQGVIDNISNSSAPRLSGDGRLVVFEGLVPGRRASCATVLLRNRETGTTSALVVERNTPAEMVCAASPAISEDGGWVAFASGAPHLVEGVDANDAGSDVYAVNVRTGEIERVSVANDGKQSPLGSSFAPSVSATGRFVAFASTACLDRNPPASSSQRMPPVCQTQVHVRDREAGETRSVKSRTGTWPNRSTHSPALSADGRYVAFVSNATNLVRGDSNDRADVYLYDMATGSIELISRTPRGGAGNGASFRPAISSTGRYVSFDSTASDLTCAGPCGRQGQDHNLVSDVFLLDRENGQMRRLSADAAGDPWWEPSIAPSLDAAARVVAFSSRHAMGPTDLRADFDLFVSVRRE